MLENINHWTVTDAELLSLIRSELDLLKSFCQDEQPNNIPPILKVWDSTKSLQMFPLSLDREFNRSSGRRQILINVGAEFHRHWGREVFPAAIILISEAWVKSFSRAEHSSVNRAPSDYPDSIECVVVQSLTLSQILCYGKASSTEILLCGARNPAPRTLPAGAGFRGADCDAGGARDD